MTDRLIRITTALAVVAVVAAVISYQHAYELVHSHGESGTTARLFAGTSPYHGWPRGALARASWLRSAPTWRMVWATARSAPWSARGPRWRWSARFELLMMLIRTGHGTQPDQAKTELDGQAVPPWAQEAQLELMVAPTLEQTIRAQYQAGHSQRAIARELNIDRR